MLTLYRTRKICKTIKILLFKAIPLHVVWACKTSSYFLSGDNMSNIKNDYESEVWEKNSTLWRKTCILFSRVGNKRLEIWEKSTFLSSSSILPTVSPPDPILVLYLIFSLSASCFILSLTYCNPKKGSHLKNNNQSHSWFVCPD